MQCTFCGEDLVEGQSAQTVPPPKIVKRGEKTGVLGLYPHPDYDGDEPAEVHFPFCCIGYFHPDDNPFVYDQVVLEVKEDIYDEVREEFLEELRTERPMCPWCKSLNVWTRIKAEGALLRYCQHCQKYWDEEEDEVPASEAA